MSFKSEIDQFGELFKQRLNGAIKATIKWVEATSVDWDNQTMIATDGEDLKYYDVLLGVGSFISKPVVGTDCLIAIVENDNATAFMLYADEVDEVYLKSDETQVTVSNEGCRIERGSENLLTVLSDFIAEVQKIIVVQGTNPDIAALDRINDRLKKVMN